MEEKSKVIFGNKISKKDYNKACKSKEKYLKKFGDDSNTNYKLGSKPNSTLSNLLGIQDVVVNDGGEPIDQEKGLIVGNIRMGFGHYRISMAIASAARYKGYTPYWFDLHAYQETSGGKIIKHLNELYSMGSRWSQKYSLFNKFYWEPLNSEGFRKLSYNAVDQKTSELMAPVYKNFPKDIPFVATHVWPAQAAIHAGLTNVVNAIPDNWQMALHLAEGSVHAVQTPSSYFGYKILNGMSKEIKSGIPEGQLYDVGHYIDHELVSNLKEDTAKRLDRVTNNKPLRILLTIGGAGAQKEIFTTIIRELIPLINQNKAVLYVNVGDHEGVWKGLEKEIQELKDATKHFDEWEKTVKFCENAIVGQVKGIHAFFHTDIFPAVYVTNLLMRSSDILATKPSELAFYPIPKLMIKRIGGHEAWGAIRAAEVGDGTIEVETIPKMLQTFRLLLNERGILKMMNENILKANEIGTYNGAYKVIELLEKKKR